MTCAARPSITADTPRPPNDSLYSLQPIRPSSVLTFRKSKLRWPASACRCSIFVTFIPDLQPRSPAPRALPRRRGVVDLRRAEADLAQDLHGVLPESGRQPPDVAGRLPVPGGNPGQTQRSFARMLHDVPEAGRLELWIREQGLQGVHDHARDALAVQVGEPFGGRPRGGDLAELLVQEFDVPQARAQRLEARVVA